MNGSWMGYWLHGDMVKKTFVMEKPNDPKKEFEFTFSHPDSRSLTLYRSDRGDQIRVKLHGLDEKQFVLLSRGIHWIDEDAGLVMEEECICDRVKRKGWRALNALKTPARGLR